MTPVWIVGAIGVAACAILAVLCVKGTVNRAAVVMMILIGVLGAGLGWAGAKASADCSDVHSNQRDRVASDPHQLLHSDK